MDKIKNPLHIAIPKTGSSSMKKVFDTKYHSHKTIGYFLEKTTNFDYSFTFVRNTYSHLVSWYVFHHDVKIEGFRNWVDAGFKVNWGRDWLASWQRNEPLDQMIWIKDKDDNVVVDYIGRFESLDEDYLNLCNILSIETPKPLPHIKPSTRVLNHKNVINDEHKKYYDLKTIKKVESKFKEEIEYFNFQY